MQRVLLRDASVAAGLTVVAQVELMVAGDRVSAPLLLQHAAFAVMTGSVALRRVAPLIATLACSVGLVAQTIAGDAPVVGGLLALLLVVATLGYHAPWRRGVVGLVAMFAAVSSYELAAGRVVVGDLVANTVIVVGAWAAGRMVRVSTDRRVAAELAADRAARDAVAAERTRIARDLHDSVAHALTLMTLQAGTARERAEQPEVAARLHEIEEAGRTAVQDMHRFLQLLGEPGEGPAEAPGLRDLDDLVAGVRAGGLPVKLHVELASDDVPPSVSSAAYRVVQEGLTNAVRHAGAASATVTVRRLDDRLEVEVHDTGRGSVRRDLPAGSGRGLDGLRERVALFGGTLTAGADTFGGWRLAATIPTNGAA